VAALLEDLEAAALRHMASDLLCAGDDVDAIDIEIAKASAESERARTHAIERLRAEPHAEFSAGASKH
jgi:hypothetical protein